MTDLFEYIKAKAYRNKVVVLIALIMFGLLSGYNIATPGLYYDELLFVNAALSGEINMFIHARIGDLPVMLMPYIGALKAWFYHPIFEIFGVSVFSVRWPVIIIGCISLWVNYKFMKMAFTNSAAIIFILLAAVEPSTLYHTRLDWGPTAFMMLFRGLLLLYVFSWIKTRDSKFLLLAALVACLGAFDKLNFIWSVVAVMLSVILFYPDRLMDLVRYKNNKYAIFVVLAVIGGLVVIIGARSSIKFSDEFITSDWVYRLQYVLNMLRVTVGGSGVFNVVVGNGHVDVLARYQLIVLCLSAILAMILFLTHRTAQVWRPLLFITSVIFFIILQVFMTRQATGPHHMAMIAPLWLMPIAAMIGVAIDSENHAMDMPRKLLSAFAIVSIILSSIWVDSTYLKAFNGPVKPAWDSSSNKLVAVIEEEIDNNNNVPVVCVDWGLGTIIYSLLDGRVNIQDNWPAFKNGLSGADVEYYEKNIISKNAVFVIPGAGMEAFPETRRNFFSAAASHKWDLTKISEITRQNGSVIYELYKIGNTN